MPRLWVPISLTALHRFDSLDKFVFEYFHFLFLQFLELHLYSFRVLKNSMDATRNHRGPEPDSKQYIAIFYIACFINFYLCNFPLRICLNRTHHRFLPTLNFGKKSTYDPQSEEIYLRFSS